jgi:hypothetical protein
MILLMATTVFACKEDDVLIPGGSSETLEVSEADKIKSFEVAGGSATVKVKTRALFTLEATGGNWLTVSEIISIGDTTSFQINAGENVNVEARSGKVTLSLKGAEDIEIEVFQDGSSALAVGRSSLEFNSSASEKTVSVNSGDYTVSIENGEGWLSATPSPAGLRVRTEANTGQKDRSAIVVIHVDGYQDAMLRVKQNVYAPPSLIPEILDFTYLGEEQIITVKSDQGVYTATVETDASSWLSARVLPTGLRIKVSDNYDNIRTGEVLVHVEGEDDLVLTVTQGAMPTGTGEGLADRKGWIATARGKFSNGWTSSAVIDGETYPGGSPQLVLDGNVNTGWHTDVAVPEDTAKKITAVPAAPLPHCMVVDMKAPQIVTGVQIDHIPGHPEWVYFKTIRVYLSKTPVIPEEARPIWGTPTEYTYGGGVPFRINISGENDNNKGRYLILYFPDSTCDEGKSPYISFTELNVYVRK